MIKTDFNAEKQLVRNFYARLDKACEMDIPEVLEAFTSPEYLWRGFHPFNEITSAQKVGESFWQPLRGALTLIQRRIDVFMAGQNSIAEQGGVWVVSMGHLMGLFDQPWLGIPQPEKSPCCVIANSIGWTMVKSPKLQCFLTFHT